MSILSTLSALQGPVVLLLVIVGPSTVPRILNSILRIRRRRLQPASPKLPPRPPLALPAKALVALHIIYRLYSLIQPPFNVFTTYNLPLFASNDSLRQRLLPFVSATPGDLSFSPSKTSVERSEIEHLLLKLTSLDNRLLYARFGHEPLLRCGWCASVEDYGVAAAPRTAAAYALTAVMLGIVGLSVVSGPTAVARKRAWRGAISWVVGLGVIADMGARWAWNLRVVDGDTLQVSAGSETPGRIMLIQLAGRVYPHSTYPIAPPPTHHLRPASSAIILRSDPSSSPSESGKYHLDPPPDLARPLCGKSGPGYPCDSRTGRSRGRPRTSSVDCEKGRTRHSGDGSRRDD